MTPERTAPAPRVLCHLSACPRGLLSPERDVVTRPGVTRRGWFNSSPSRTFAVTSPRERLAARRPCHPSSPHETGRGPLMTALPWGPSAESVAGPEETPGVRAGTGLTCGEDDVPRDQPVLHDGELRELDPLHPGDGLVPAAPVELDVVRGVAICRERRAGTWRQEASASRRHTRPRGAASTTEGAARPPPRRRCPTSRPRKGQQGADARARASPPSSALDPAGAAQRGGVGGGL